MSDASNLFYGLAADPPISDGATGQRLNVWLVHGTWARGIFERKPVGGRPGGKPIWSDLGSPFAQTLAKELGQQGYAVRMFSVHWSGANSVVHRDQTARSLARSIETISDANAINLLIGHSHGGSIVLTAAAEYLKTPMEIMVVTLATPFIDMFARTDRRSEQYGRTMSGLHQQQLVKLGLAANLLALALVLLIHPHADNWWVWMAFLGVNTVATIALNNVYARYGDSLNNVAPTYGAMTRTAHVRLLVLRGIDDEAALSIAAGTIQAMLVGPLLRVVGLLLFAASALWVALFYAMTKFGDMDLLQILRWVAVVLSVYLGLALLQSTGRAVLGREFFFTGQIYEVNVNSAPDLAGEVAIRTLAGRMGQIVTPIRAGLRSIKSYTYRRRHSLYEHKDCIGHIVGWVLRQAGRVPVNGGSIVEWQ